MSSKEKLPLWHYLYSFCVIGAAILAYLKFMEIPPIEGYQYHDIVLFIIIISIIFIAEKTFLFISKLRKNGERGRDGSRG